MRGINKNSALSSVLHQNRTLPVKRSLPVLPGLLAMVCVTGFISCNSGPAPEMKQPDAAVEYHDVLPFAVEPAALVAKPEPAGTNILLLLASDFLEKGDYNAALASFGRIDQDDAAKTEIALLRASVLISAGRSTEARTIVNEILKDNPANIPALLVLSSVEESQNRNKEQRAVLEKILSLEPDNVTALVSMGKLMVRSSAVKQAGPYFDRALAKDPVNGEALLGRAWVYRNTHEPKKAEELLNRAIELYPEWGRAFQEPGRLYKSAGFTDRALSDLNRAKDLDENNYFIACDRADALKNLNRKQEALAEYNRAVSINPEYFLAYVFSSVLKEDLGDYDGALGDYKKLALLNPDYYFAFEGLGMHLMRLSRWLEAKDAFVEAYRRAAIKNGRANSADEAMYMLLAAVCALHGGKRKDAEPFLDEALRKVPRDSMEYRMLRLFRDWSGDTDIAGSIDKEKNPLVKSRMLFYLAHYYDIRGNKNLAKKFFLEIRDLDAKETIEWRINEWSLEAGGLVHK